MVLAVQQLETATALCTSLVLNICLRFDTSNPAVCSFVPRFHYILQNISISYGARGEIVNACKKISAQVSAGTVNVGDINEQLISAALSTHDCPGNA